MKTTTITHQSLSRLQYSVVHQLLHNSNLQLFCLTALSPMKASFDAVMPLSFNHLTLKGNYFFPLHIQQARQLRIIKKLLLVITMENI